MPVSSSEDSSEELIDESSISFLIWVTIWFLILIWFSICFPSIFSFNFWIQQNDTKQTYKRRFKKIENRFIKGENGKNFKTDSGFRNTKNDKIKFSKEVEKLFKDLKKLNEKLWIIEDEIRLCESNSDFKDKFIQLARDVYFTNDQRAKVKSEINKLLGSNIKEIKQYSNY